MVEKRRLWTHPSSGDDDTSPSLPIAKPRWQACCSSDEDVFRCSGRNRIQRRRLPRRSGSNSQDVSKKEQQRSSTESEDVWQKRFRGEASGSKASGSKTKRDDIRNSKREKREPSPWALSDGDDQQPPSKRRSGVQVKAKPQGKPVVNLTLEAIQLKASLEIRGPLTQFEEWGMSAQRVRKVLCASACSCSKSCYKQVVFEQLGALSKW